MVRRQVVRPANYISLFDPEQIEIDANLKTAGRTHAGMGSDAAQADWGLFNESLTSEGTKSVNKGKYHIATLLGPAIPPEHLEVLAYIIEWKLIFAGENSHHHPPIHQRY
jgi:hypothetical protein